MDREKEKTEESKELKTEEMNSELIKDLGKFGASGLIAFLAFYLINVGDKQLTGNRAELTAYILSQQHIIETCVGVDTNLPTADQILLRPIE